MKTLTTIIKVLSLLAGGSAYAGMIPEKYLPIATLAFMVASGLKDVAWKIADYFDNGKVDGSFKLPVLFLVGIVTLSFTGCAGLAPGARPVVVRAEQSIAVATATFDTAVHIDDANTAFFRTNLPPFHQFCEWLRAPVIMLPLTNTFPRGLAIVYSADAVKETYKKTNSTNDYAALINSLAVVETATAQAQKFILQTSTKQ